MTLKTKLLKFFYTCLPYAIAILIGIIFLILGESYDYYPDVMVSLSSTAFALLFVNAIFDIFKTASKYKLTKVLRMHSHFKICKFTIGVVYKLYRIANASPNSQTTVKEAFNIDNLKLKEIMQNNQYIGFDIFVDWEFYMTEIESLLNSNAIINHTQDKTLIALTVLCRSINEFDCILTKDFNNIFIKCEDKNSKSIEIQKDCNDQKILYINDKAVSWGCNNKKNHELLSHTYKVAPDAIKGFSNNINVMIERIKILVDSFETKEFLLDPKDIKH